MIPVPTVLVVEDDAAILSSLAEVIRDEGFAVETAANGYQALARIEACEPDLIFLDLMMPRMDGWRFIAELRLRTPSRQVPIVLVSAAANLGTEASKLGVRHFLRKPFDLEDVVRITRECCRGPGNLPSGAARASIFIGPERIGRHDREGHGPRR